MAHGGHLSGDSKQLVAHLTGDTVTGTPLFEQLLALAHTQGGRMRIGGRQRCRQQLGGNTSAFRGESNSTVSSSAKRRSGVSGPLRSCTRAPVGIAPLNRMGTMPAIAARSRSSRNRRTSGGMSLSSRSKMLSASPMVSVKR
jgi:hypothetical protein